MSRNDATMLARIFPATPKSGAYLCLLYTMSMRRSWCWHSFVHLFFYDDHSHGSGGKYTGSHNLCISNMASSDLNDISWGFSALSRSVQRTTLLCFCDIDKNYDCFSYERSSEQCHCYRAGLARGLKHIMLRQCGWLS
jgi:hypothetical protein